MKAVALLLLVAVVSLSTVPDGGYDPFRLTTLDPAPSGRGEAVDRSPSEWRPVPLLIFEGFASGSRWCVGVMAEPPEEARAWLLEAVSR